MLLATSEKEKRGKKRRKKERKIYAHLILISKLISLSKVISTDILALSLIMNSTASHTLHMYQDSVKKAILSALTLCGQFQTQAPRGAGIAQWLERRTRGRKVAGSNPCWSGGRIFLLQGQLSVLTLISVSVPPPCYRSST